jgi:hypothetical protein
MQNKTIMKNTRQLVVLIFAHLASSISMKAACFTMAMVVLSGGMYEGQAQEILDTRGPILNPGMTVKVDAEGMQAPGYRYVQPEPREKWEGNWIGTSTPSIPDVLGICLRKEFVLKQAPTKVTAWIYGDRFLLFINGLPAARGPADSGRDIAGTQSGRNFYDGRDFTGLFHKGQNSVAVETKSGFLFEARVDYADGTSEVLKSDATWRGIANPYLKQMYPVDPSQAKRMNVEASSIPIGAKQTTFDATAEPIGWQLTGFDDSTWPVCRAGALPDNLVMSELPPLMEARYPYFKVTEVNGQVTVPDNPLQPGHPIVVHGDGDFAVQFSRVMAGRCGIKIKGCSGAQVYLEPGESYSRRRSLCQILLRDGVQYFENRNYSAIGVIRVIVRNATQPVEIQEVNANAWSQSVEYRGSFTCSDDTLNALWKSGRWSNQICMITHHLDSPNNREPLADYGDYMIADLIDYNTLGNNHELARQDLRKFAWILDNAKYETFHTSYIFCWLQALMNYYDYTGDTSLIQELAPQVHGVIDKFTSYIGKNGIISEAPNYMFMDFSPVCDDKDPKIKYDCHHPPAVIGQGYMTALYYRGLADAIRVCQITKNETTADKYRDQRGKVLRAYSNELWNPSRGLFRDGKPFVTSIQPHKWLPADVQMESFSTQNNIMAVLYDLTPKTLQAPIMETMLNNKNWDMTRYFMNYVFNALEHTDLFAKYGVPRMLEFKVESDTRTVRELGPTRGDYSHAWVGSPTYQMSGNILGVRPLSPGFATFAIRPTTCGLSFAKGVVPSPHGDIQVDWEVKDRVFRLKTIVPENTSAVVSLPVGTVAQPTLKVGGKVLWSGGKIQGDLTGCSSLTHRVDRLELTLAPGAYQMELGNYE